MTTRLRVRALFIAGTLLASVLCGASVASNGWQAVPDGPHTWAVSRTYGEAEWSEVPGRSGGVVTVDACRNVPDERMARDIAEFLNGNR